MIKEICGIAFDCKNATALAEFYEQLLGWEKQPAGAGWAALRSPQGWVMAFQEVSGYVAPTWPWESGKQQQMAHIDFYVENLEQAVDLAIRCGGRKADTQYYTTSTVILDPEGHPFCLSTVKE